MSKASWPMVALGEILCKSDEWIDIKPDERYREVTVRLWGKGVIQRREVAGVEISATRKRVVRSKQFILSRIDARNGAFGLIPNCLDGAIVSNDFPVFNLNLSRIIPRFLEWMSKTEKFVDLCRKASEGTTNRVRLKENRFLEMKISLPPLSEQRRIVARIEELSGKVEEAQSLRQQAIEEVKRLLICMAHRQDLGETTKSREGWRRLPLSKCVQLVDDSHLVEAVKSYPNLGIYSFGRGLFQKPPIDGALTSANRLRRVKQGQFIYSRLFAFEGACGMVTDEFDGYFVSGEYPTFNCNPDFIRVEFLASYFKSPAVWRDISAGSKGLGDRRQRVQPKEVLDYILWIPPLSWQNLIAEMQTKMDVLKNQQEKTRAELGALLPSILDKAFKGKL